MLAADQAASVVVPSSAAVPEPPRSLAHLTLYSRMLSAALPPSPTTPLLPVVVWPEMLTVGATWSILLQRRRSASSMVAPSALTSSVAAPPQPTSVSTVVASNAASNRMFNLSFIRIVLNFVGLRSAFGLTGRKAQVAARGGRVHCGKIGRKELIRAALHRVLTSGNGPITVAALTD